MDEGFWGEEVAAAGEVGVLHLPAPEPAALRCRYPKKQKGCIQLQ